MKEKIFVDMDHVIADLINPWVNKYNCLYNDNLRVEQITTWDWHHLVKPECSKTIYKLLTPDLFEELPVINGSQEVLHRLSSYYEIYIVTAAGNANIIPAKAKWLKEHFPFIKKDRVVYAVDKSICRGEYLIDDKPENLETFEGNKILFNASHNQEEHRFLRMNDWYEIERYFNFNEEYYREFTSESV